MVPVAHVLERLSWRRRFLKGWGPEAHPLTPRRTSTSSAAVVVLCEKDGDLSTSWSCTGSEREADDGTITYECDIDFNMMYRRHIREVRIGERGTAPALSCCSSIR